jgi:hypothetical protein
MNNCCLYRYILECGLYSCACCMYSKTVLSISEADSGAAKWGYIPGGGSSEGISEPLVGEG